MSISSSNSGLLAIPGMVSGLPTQSIIQSLVAARQQEEVPLQNQEAAINNQIQAWNGITPAFTDFQNALQTLLNPSTWSSMTATSSNTSVVSVSANTTAMTGAYNVNAVQLAQGQTTVSNVFTKGNTNVGVAGDIFSISDPTGTKSYQVKVNQGDSLQTIASAINMAVNGNLNVSASVITNADGSQQLMVASTQTGTANAFQMQDVNGTFLSSTLGINTSNTPASMQAKDAIATVNNVQVTSSTNTFTNAIQGVTFTLNQGTGGASVSLTQNTQAITDAMNSFMKTYNTLIQNLQAASKINTSGISLGSAPQGNGPLAGDTTIQGIMMNLATTVGNVVGTYGDVNGLESLGIVLNTDGTLGFDTSAVNGQQQFTNMLSTDQNNIKNMLGVVSTDGLTSQTGLGGLLNNLISQAIDPVSGLITNEVSGLNSTNSMLGSEIKQMDQANQQYQDMLTAQFNAMEATISAFKAQGSWLSSFAGMSTSSSSSSGSNTSSSLG